MVAKHDQLYYADKYPSTFLKNLDILDLFGKEKFRTE